MTLALLRPDAWDVPVFVHVLGATLLVGALTAAASALLARPRRETDGPVLARIGFWSLAAGFPAWVLTRVGGQWAEAREGFVEEPAWLEIGYAAADAGLVVLLAATVLAGFAARRPALRRAAGALATLLLAVYLVAIWAMTTKPS